MAENNTTEGNIFEIARINDRRVHKGKSEYLVQWKYHQGPMWTKLHNLQCLEAILQFECFGTQSTSDMELKSCKVTSDNQVFIEWNNPIGSHLLKLPVDVVQRVDLLIKEEVSIRVGNYDVRPSGPHPPGLLKMLCGFRDLRNMQLNLEAVKLEERSDAIDTEIKFKYFIDALQYFTEEKCIYNSCEVTLYSKVEPIIWMAIKDMPDVKVECGFNVIGTKYKEDIVVVKKNIQEEFIPFLIIELKPIIHSDLNGCHPADVNESLLYGKYIIERYKLEGVSLLCALSDVQNWHVLDYNGTGIQTYYKFSNGKNYLLLYGYVCQLIQIKYKQLQKY